MATRKKAGAPGKTKAPKKKTPPKKNRPLKKTGTGKKITTPKKAGQSKKAGSRKQKKINFLKEFKKIFLGIAILVAVCLTMAMLADIFINQANKRPEKKELQKKESSKILHKDEKSSAFLKKQQIEPVFENTHDVQNKKPADGLMEKSLHPIIYEVFEDVDHSHVKKKPVVPEAGDDIPRIAIIIDDIGYDRQMAMELYDLDPGITFSVLPFSPFGNSISQKLHAKGAEIMLHLPMEPVEYPEVNPGPGALLSSMTPDILLDQLRKNLQDVPGAAGVNNHMGSKLTAQSDKINQIFTILKKEDLFFIDSRTSPVSQGKASARLLKLKFAQRDVFLDNVQDITYITGQLQSLIRIAKKHGTAIGIGHPYKTTLHTLEIELPKLKGKVRIVPASTLTIVHG
ncbi:MAG: hypothetical protein B6230_04570 [Desulfobacteraceae bacterium 4572_89]|nr:MAG: hypothetical protein B6230_04570 [Desulfobacteraceae bacterium 4572_89]